MHSNGPGMVGDIAVDELCDLAAMQIAPNQIVRASSSFRAAAYAPRVGCVPPVLLAEIARGVDRAMASVWQHEKWSKVVEDRA